MVISVAKILELAIHRAGHRADGSHPTAHPVTTLPSFRRACEVIKRTVSDASEVPIAAIQGPPGTGKTTLVVESLIRILKENIKYDIIVYIAPTNNLVAEAAVRTLEGLISNLYGKSKDFINILRKIRILGSQICSHVSDKEIETLSKLLELNERSVLDILRTITSRSITIGKSGQDIPYIIFTTEWTNIAVLFEHERGLKIAVFFDEASRSPLHRVFTPLANILYKLIRSGSADSVRENLEQKYNIRSLVVIGDPEQTISSREYRDMHIYVGGRRYKLSWLALELSIQLLNKMKLINDQFVMLDTTLRIPKLGEKPISVGFYNDKLRATTDLHERLGNYLKDIYTHIDNICEKLKRCCNKLSRTIDKVAELVKESFDPNKPAPIGIMRISTYKPSQEIELTRSVVGALIAVILYHVLTEVLKPPVTIGVISPYVAQVNFTRTVFRYIFRKIGVHSEPENVVFRTVHAVLGCEYDFVIALLGKEYPYASLEGQGFTTMYCSQPEVLNVQLSRQRTQLYIVGNVAFLEGSFDSSRLSYRDRRVLRNVAKVCNTARTLLDYAASGVYRMKSL